MEPDGSAPRWQVPATRLRGVCECSEHVHFEGEEFLAPRPTPKLKYHTLSAVRDCLFNTFAATLHIGGRSSIRNLRTRTAVVTGTHLSCFCYRYLYVKACESKYLLSNIKFDVRVTVHRDKMFM